MPGNSKQKVMVVTAVLATLVTAFLIASVTAPGWVSYSSSFDIGTFQGLFRWCKGDVCRTNNFQITGSSPLLPNPLTCGRSGNEVADRFQATAAMLIAGVITAGVVLLCQFGQYFGLELSEKFNAGVGWLSAVAFLFLLIGVAIFGGTVNSWWNCGADFCQQFNGTNTHCGVGYSYIFCIVGMIILLAVSILNVVCAKMPHILHASADMVLMIILLQIVAISLTIVGLTTDHWQEVVINHKRFGLFTNCTASRCDTSSFPLTFVSMPGCNVTGTTLQSRLYASSSFLIVGLTITAVLAVFFVLVHLKVSTKFLLTRSMKKRTLAAVLFSLGAQVLGLILVTNVTDSFYYCGRPFCDFNRGYCQQGLSFAFAVTSIGLTALMMMLLLFEFNEWCCFQERFASGRQKFSIMKVLRSTKARGGTSAEPAEDEAEDEGAIELPAGTWDYDSLSGFYWSEELYLFYDPVTQQFYDPNKDEWFARQQPQQSPVPALTRLPAASAGSMRKNTMSAGGGTGRASMSARSQSTVR